MKIARHFVATALLVACLTAPVTAEEFYGPLRIRDMGPFQLLRLHMLPDHAVPPEQGRYALEFHLSHSNTFVMDEDVFEYLEARDRRGEINGQDVAAIRDRADNAFLFDGELGHFQLTGHYAFADRWSGYVSLPVHYFAGGLMDSAIENFHERFGFDTFGREYISRNDFQAVVVVDGQAFHLLERPTRGGIGDPVVGLRYYHALEGHAAFTVELAHKFAVQDPDTFRSTGSADTGLQLSWHAHGTRNSIYASLAVVHAGRAEPFPENTRRLAPSFNVAWEYLLGENLNLVAQLNAARSVFEDGADPELTADVYQGSLGLRHRTGDFVWSYALTENLLNFNNTADLGFHLGFAWLPQ